MCYLDSHVSSSKRLSAVVVVSFSVAIPLLRVGLEPKPFRLSARQQKETVSFISSKATGRLEDTWGENNPNTKAALLQTRLWVLTATLR